MTKPSPPAAWYLYLVRTHPGHDATAFEALSAATSHGTNGRAFYALDSCDIVLLLHGPGAEQCVLELGTQESIRWIVELSCEIVGDNESSRLRAAPPKNVASACFLRMPSALEVPGDPAAEFTAWWHSNPDESSILLATLGGPHYIAINFFDSIRNANEWIARLAVVPVIRDSHSILMIAATSLTLAAGDWDLLPGSAQVHARVAWKNLPGPSLLQSIPSLPNHYIHCGRDDATIVFKSAQPTWHLSEPLTWLRNYRMEHCSDLESTGLSILIPGEEALGSHTAIEQTLPLHKATNSFHISAKEAISIRSLSEVGPQVLRFLYSFADALDEPFLDDDLADIAHTWWIVKHQALSLSHLRETDRKRRLRMLSELTHYSGRALHQRLHGVNASASGIITSLRFPIGGIGRTLRAAGSIPFSVISALSARGNKKQWPGFVCVGSYRRFESNEHGIIFLPESFLLQPERFIGLIHEAAHCFLLLDPPFKSTLCATTHRADESIVEEIFADLIDFHFSPSWNPQTWQREFWSYVVENFDMADLNSDQKAMFALRALVVHTTSDTEGRGYCRDLIPVPVTATTAQNDLTRTAKQRAKNTRDQPAIHADTAPWKAALECLQALRDQPHFVEMIWNELPNLLATVDAVLPFDANCVAQRKRQWEAAWNNKEGRLITELPEDFCPALLAWRIWELSTTPLSPTTRSRALGLLIGEWRGQFRARYKSPTTSAPPGLQTPQTIAPPEKREREMG